MEHKVDTNQYPTVEAFYSDGQLIFENCLQYNPEGSVYAKGAVKLRKILDDRFAEYSKRS
jgi:histone acetyltransferase